MCSPKWGEVLLSFPLEYVHSQIQQGKLAASWKGGGEARLTVTSPASFIFVSLKESRDFQLCLDCKTSKSEEKIMANTNWVGVYQVPKSVLRALYALTRRHLLILC